MTQYNNWELNTRPCDWWKDLSN